MRAGAERISSSTPLNAYNYMKYPIPLIRALGGGAIALLLLAVSTVNAQTDPQAWATAGSPDGGGNNSPSGGAAWSGSVGGGGFNFHNGPIIGDWDDFADFGTLIFNASFDSGSFNNAADLSSNYIWNWGLEPDNTATYGQTFVAPNYGNLDSFSFYLQGGDDGSYDIQAFVMTWSGGLIGGESHDESHASILWASQPFLYTPNNASLGSDVWQEVTANIPDGGLSLTAGDDYLIGFSTLGVQYLPPVGPGSNVPDTASSLVLLGAALAGLAGLRRTKAFAAVRT